VYVTALFPYVVLIILFIHNVMLEGAIEGIKFYVVSTWDQLYNIKVRIRNVSLQWDKVNIHPVIREWRCGWSTIVPIRELELE